MKVTILGICQGSELLNKEPYWGDPKGNTFYDKESVNKTQARVSRLAFPCEMVDTGEKNIFKHRILLDEFGQKWSECHFILGK